MDTKDFLKTVCEEIKYKPVRKGISEELETHIQEIKEEYINSGMNEVEAEEKAVSQMGTAQDIGRKLNKIHRPKFDWKLFILILVLIVFGLIVSILKSNEAYGYVGQELIYIIIGLALGTVIYFFDYRKIKSYSNLIYLIAVIIMLMPNVGVTYKLNGMNYMYFAGIAINLCTLTIPMFIIAFVGYLVDYNKNNILKIKIFKKEIFIKKDLLKILASCILAIMLILYIPSYTNAVILIMIYLIMAIIKAIKDRENKLKKCSIILGIASICIVFFLLLVPSWRMNKIITSFKPELDPDGSGYTGMLQKKILENARLFGEAETEELLDDESIISKDSEFTFIYLVRKSRNSIIRLISINNNFSFNKTYH